ncbi:sulfatase [Prolixibacteraceae bacterium Z1-6]|uniref:Sulfatase n=1 Tax=Draconibacterium aestuarii TaxID=2998507 RepID=A0A9X3F5E7_9BACT|nr:sulfatase [Prolixibacteraceae bacterium Z1-6]
MRNIFYILLGIFVLTSCSQTATKQKNTKRPNILFIMSDDHALQAIGAYGHPISKLAPTPNIDRLAAEGVLFQENYCANSICGPSRATVLTGKHSHANGFIKNDGTKFDGHQPTIPNILQQNGYETAVIGKWHLNTDPVGFDFYKILNDQGEYNNPDFITKDTTLQIMGYVTDIITDLSKDWLDNRDESKPFFLMMQHKAPHRNWVPNAKYYRLYENVEFPVPDNFFDDYEGREAAALQEMNIFEHGYEGHDLKMVTGVDSDSLLFDPWPHVFFGRMTDAERIEFLDAYRERNNDYYQTERTEKEKAEWKLQRYLQDYLATVKSVDESVGEIYDYLEENDLLDNTIVVYTSDQGFFLGEHGWFDKRWMYEESFRMPLMILDPSSKEQGRKISELTQNIDFAPTFLEMAGLPVPEEMQGRSFWPLMKGEELEEPWRDALYYHYYEFPGFHSVRAHNGVKTDRYKLIHFYNEDRWEMFDLKKDPTEMKNIYGDVAYRTIQAMLHKKHKELIEQYNVPEEYLK